MNSTTLGVALYAAAQQFNDVPVADMETTRTQFWEGIAAAIISHIEGNATVTVPATGLTSGGRAISGTASGTIQ